MEKIKNFLKKVWIKITEKINGQSEENLTKAEEPKIIFPTIPHFEPVITVPAEPLTSEEIIIVNETITESPKKTKKTTKKSTKKISPKSVKKTTPKKVTNNKKAPIKKKK